MLFLIHLRYQRPLSELDGALPGHREFLARHFAAGHFLLSGPLVPREGGLILAQADTRETVLAWLPEDPFVAQGLVTWEVLGWQPNQGAALIPPGWVTPPPKV